MAGFEISAAIDNWEKATNVYTSNFDHEVILHDISQETKTLKIIENYQPDLIIGGPPCQDFSSAGKRDETLGRADLTSHFANLICDYKPRLFVMENVERVKKSRVLQEAIKHFRSNNYSLTGVILNAAYCEVPQARNRFFLIGELAGSSNNLLNEIMTRNLSNKQMTMRDYFGNSLGIEYYYRHPRNYSRRGIYSIDEPSPAIRGVNRPIPKGYKKHRSDPKDADLNHLRPLTTIERSYVQTFPKNFKFEGTKTNLEQMIGNAVPVNLSKFVAQSILEYLDCKTDRLKQSVLFNLADSLEIPTKALKPIV